ncbi:hypothetical protein QBE52_14850 [Clostridiaceae bacterium 35-E11]
MKIKTIKIGYTMEDAKEILLKRSNKFSILKTKMLYYPYLKIIFIIKTSKFANAKRFNGHVVCTVDMVTGRESLAKSHGNLEDIEVEDCFVMPSKISEEDARKRAALFIGMVVMQKVKVLKIPTVTNIEDEIIYRPFYIVHCKNDTQEDFFLMFDAVTGQFTPLDTMIQNVNKK